MELVRSRLQPLSYLQNGDVLSQHLLSDRETHSDIGHRALLEIPNCGAKNFGSTLCRSSVRQCVKPVS